MRYRSKLEIDVYQFDGTQENLPKWIADIMIEWTYNHKSKDDYFMFTDDYGHFADTEKGVKHACLSLNGRYFYKGHYFVRFSDTGKVEAVYKDRIVDFLKDFGAIE